MNQFDGEKEYIIGLGKSVIKMMMYWVISAKRPEKRQSRISKVTEASLQKTKAKTFS